MAANSNPKRKPLIVEATFGKDTPNAIQFKEDDKPDGSRADIGTLYVTKKAANEHGIGRRVRITVETID
jgi:hypothetical protein